MHRQPDLFCLIDGAKVGRKILLGEKRDGKGKNGRRKADGSEVDKIG